MICDNQRDGHVEQPPRCAETPSLTQNGVLNVHSIWKKVDADGLNQTIVHKPRQCGVTIRRLVSIACKGTVRNI
jgi:hypothetical protein